MRFPIALVVLAGMAVAVSGCESVKETVGLTKQAPDEFAVYRRAPLSLPPDYGLRPPEPGAASTRNLDPKQDAKRALTGDRMTAAPTVQGATPGLQALMQRTGVGQAEPGIRETINRETSVLTEEDKTFTEKLMFWDKSQPKATVVDPTKETKRIQENQALGKPITEGESATIERKEKGLLEGLLPK